MLAQRSKTATLVLLATVLMVSSVALVAVTTLPAAHVSGPAASPAVAPASAPAPAAPTAPTNAPSTVARTTGNLGSEMAASAIAATQAAGLKSYNVFVPRASATPAQVAESRAAGHVVPLYSGSPAPMGLAYYGLSAGVGGQVVPTILNTTSVESTIEMNSTGVVPINLVDTSPDAFTIQMNAVLSNITLFGQGPYSFWTQNVIVYFPSAQLLEFETNVWNFTGGPLTTNVFYSHGPYGHQVGTDYYYAAAEVPFPVSYPFNLTLWMNSTLSGGRDNASFDVAFSNPLNPSEDFAAPYDWVVFNSTAAVGGQPLTTPSNYTANGFTYNPIGLTDDFEVDFGGPGGGSQATLFGADATLGLAYLSDGKYVSVPSAYSYGGETGETDTGANVAWTTASDGMLGAGPTTYGTMTTGPSVLTGLWNATGPSGSYPVTLHVTPTNAFNLVATGGGWSSNFTVSEFAVAPELYTNVLNLEPGTYTLETELSDYVPVITTLDVTGPQTLTISLTPSSAMGIYTPLWAFNNAGLAALSTAGAGTPTSPYQIVNNQYGVIDSAFGLYNDYGFPAYPGVFFYGTTASVALNDPPSFATATNDFQFPGPDLPSVNDLQYWFDGVSNLALTNAKNISGWFDNYVFYPADFDTFNVIFYDSSNNLIAGNTFNTQAGALVLFVGGTAFGAVNFAGGNNTVWGNYFNTVGTPSSAAALVPYYFSLGIEVAETNDLIYNNYVATPTTAWTLPLNLYTGYPEYFGATTTWNLAEQPATNVNYASGFPNDPLTGSIIGTSYQGGNYWWDYGVAFNPYNGANNPFGVTYDENAPTLLVDVYGPYYYYATYIFPGGDAVPLTPYTAFYAVTISEKGLPSGLVWSVDLVTAGAQVFGLFDSTASSYTVNLPDGTYALGYDSPTGWVITGMPPASLKVDGAPVSVSLTYAMAKGYHKLTFKESGLPTGTAWSVTINGTSPTDWDLNATETSTTTSIVFSVVKGAGLTYTVTPVSGYVANDKHGTVSGSTVKIKFSPYTFAVTFTEMGLAPGATWDVKIGKKTYKSDTSTIVVDLGNGTYSYTVKGPHGETPTPSSGTFSVVDNTKGLMISFSS